MAKVLRRILAVLCLLAAVFFLLPLGIGILHFGMVWPAALLLLCAAWLTWPDFFRRLLRPKWLRALAGCVIAVCMTAILVTLGKWPWPPRTGPPTDRTAPWWCWAARSSRTATPA